MLYDVALLVQVEDGEEVSDASRGGWVSHRKLKVQEISKVLHT